MAMRIQASSAISHCSALTAPLILHLTRRKSSAVTTFRPPPLISSRNPPPNCLSHLVKPPSSSMSLQPPQARRGFSSSSSSSQERQQDFATPEEDLCFQTPLKIVEYPDPLLRARNKRINTFDDNLRKLVHEMFDVMYKTDGIGLSAPQVGINVQLMVFNPAGERGEGEEIVLVNPVVYKASKKTLLYNEGCLSFPGIYADVERPASVKIDARDITGARFKVNLSGLPARVFQHEFDHLQGILFFDRMSKDVLESICSELKALEKKYEERTGQPTPERIDNYEGLKVAVGFART